MKNRYETVFILTPVLSENQAKETVKKGAPKEDTKDFSSMTVTQLKEEAKAKGIQGISSMKKADLIAALSKQLK